MKAFQARNGLEVDGVVGPATMGALGISGSPATGGGGGGGSALSSSARQIGTPYVLGGTQPGGFDCSGLLVYAFKQVGVSLPRTSFQQWNVGAPVSRANIQAGDLVFFNANGPGASHVGHRDVELDGDQRDVTWRDGALDRRLVLGLHYIGARRV